jgi:hypothetical protein
MPTCCQWAPGGGDRWCASPSAEAIAASFALALASPGTNSISGNEARTVDLDLALFPRIRQLDARVASVCAKDLLQHGSEAELLVHELQVAVIGLSAQLIGKSPQFRFDYRRGLSNVALQCVDRVCQSVLGVIGSALGYAAVLEIVGSALVLLAYFRLHPEQRIELAQLAAIATEAPELPDVLSALPGRASISAAELDALVQLVAARQQGQAIAADLEGGSSERVPGCAAADADSASLATGRK